MNYAQMRKFDVSNGEGIRATLFVSGCTRNCKGCFNKEYQDFNYGKFWDKDEEDKFISYLKDSNVHGVTILGGEPMDQINDDTIIKLISRIKNETNQSIWIYSGYEYESIVNNLKQRRILEGCDVLVDGPFKEDEKDIRLKFRGSANQRIIDIKASINAGKVVLYKADIYS